MIFDNEAIEKLKPPFFMIYGIYGIFNIIFFVIGITLLLLYDNKIKSYNSDKTEKCATALTDTKNCPKKIKDFKITTIVFVSLMCISMALYFTIYFCISMKSEEEYFKQYNHTTKQYKNK